MTIGIYGISSQSGRAFLADYLNKGYKIIGYTRPSQHGNEVIDTIHNLNGLFLERPENANKEISKFITLGQSCVTSDLAYLVDNSDIIIIPLPSTAHLAAIIEMNKAGLGKKRIPIILSPSRSCASPYIWRILGDKYPIICFSTCPYSCKAPKPEVALIKRRKRTYVASLEGDINRSHVNMLRELFPQAALTTTPALTSLNNIGAVFHCATYLLNYDEILKREKSGHVFSFYMDGIAKRPEVGAVLESIDQVRLQIADKLGFSTFGLKSHMREDIWRKLTNGLRALEEEHNGEIDILRKLRRLFLEYLSTSITSAQHWLDITYGVYRIEGESLSDAIGRTPTYQKNSVPQKRYITEDIPTGLVPLEALSMMLDVDCSPISDIINLYNTRFNDDIRIIGRNLKEFDHEYIINYLKGNVNTLVL